MARYYLAYGSNLNLNQMAYRCPNAKKVGSYLLKNYELEFRYYLTIKKKVGATVPLGIFEIDQKDEIALDRYEGYPTHYRKEKLKVELDGKEIEALVYVMNESVREVMPPSPYYFEVVRRGYIDFGFKDHYLIEALRRSNDHE